MHSVKKTTWVGVIVLVLGMMSTAIWPGDAEAGEAAFAVFGVLPISHLILMCGGLLGLAVAGHPRERRIVSFAPNSQ